MTAGRTVRNSIAVAAAVVALVGLAACGTDGSELEDFAADTTETVPLDTATTQGLGLDDTGAGVGLAPGPCNLVTAEHVVDAVGPVVGEQGLEERGTCTWTAQEGGFLELVAAEGTGPCEDIREAWSLDDAGEVTIEGRDGWGVDSGSATAVLVCGDPEVIGARIVAPGENEVTQADLEDLVAEAIDDD